ncbi:MAG: DUF1553 domain-containing protein, partial [Victivallaceae bacterium]
PYLLGIWCLVVAASDPWSDGEVTMSGSKADQMLFRDWRRRQIPTPLRVSDAAFLRRVTIDLAGRLPTVEEVRLFLDDKSPAKRAGKIDELLDSDEFADLQSMYWCDALRVKSEFPINLWPNAVQSYHGYIRDAIRNNRPWNEVAFELLTASGSNFRNPPANFFRAVAERSPRALAQAAALTFMNLRLEKMSESEQAEFSNFFCRIRFKKTDEWKEEIVYTDPEPVKLVCRTPDGKRFEVACPESDPRRVFAAELIRPGNPYFARAMVNRVWQRLMGRGLVEPVDDMFRGNPGANPALLDTLGDEFTRSGFDMRKLFRTILLSAAYQSAPSADPAKEAAFASYPVRRLPAEVMIDVLYDVTGSCDSYSSVIPEPFTFLPAGTRAVTIADGSIVSTALENFGRPPRDSGMIAERKNELTASQRLYLLNSGTLFNRINALPQSLFRGARITGPKRVEYLYMHILSRPPTVDELKTIGAYYGENRDKANLGELVWALINSKEFLYQH